MNGNTSEKRGGKILAGRKSKYSSTNLNNKDLKIWREAEYIRLSQEDSNNGEDKQESNSVTSQKALLNEFVEEHDDLIVYDIYVDDGYTGTDFNRPGFQRLLEDMRNGNINCVLVKDLSRLGRNYIEVGNYIEQIFPLFNVRFIAINDSVDSFKNPMSSNTILVPFKNLINDEYAKDTSIKIKSALNGRKKKGEFIGAFPSYGYVKDKQDKHKLVIDEESAKIVKKIFEWKVNEGLGNLSICHKLNDMGVLNPTGYKKKSLNQKYNNSKMKQEDYSWCPSTIRNILKNDVYIGNVTQGKRKIKSYKIHKVEQVPEEEWITVENMHEPIIDKELFEKAQGMRKVDTRAQNNGTLNMWAGILKCADCGRAMNKKYCKNSRGTVYEYYICSTYKKKSKELELKKISNLKRCLYEDWKNDYITKDEYIDYKQKYEYDIYKIKNMIFNLDAQKNMEENARIKDSIWIENYKKHKNITKLDRDIITELIDYVEIHENKRITIHFKFMDESKKS